MTDIPQANNNITERIKMENMSLILIGLFTVMIIVAVLMIIIIIKLSGKGAAGGGISDMRREMRYEIDRSRQETLETMQSSFRNLGNMITENQRENAQMQNMRLG